MGELNFCTLADILKTAGENLSSGISSDTGLPFILIRLLHNKLSAFGVTFLRCYQLYFDIKQLTFHLPLIFLPLILFAFIGRKGWISLIAVQLAMPLMFIFNPLHLNLEQKIGLFRVYYGVLAVIGLAKLIKNYVRRNSSV